MTSSSHPPHPPHPLDTIVADRARITQLEQELAEVRVKLAAAEAKLVQPERSLYFRGYWTEHPSPPYRPGDVVTFRGSMYELKEIPGSGLSFEPLP